MEFSVSGALIPELKRTIARWSRLETEAMATELLLLDSAEAARRFLSNALQERT